MPVVEVADHAYPLRVRRPHREAGAEEVTALVVVDRRLLGAQPAPALGVVALVESAQVPSGQVAAGVVAHACSLLLGSWSGSWWGSWSGPGRASVPWAAGAGSSGAGRPASAASAP